MYNSPYKSIRNYKPIRNIIKTNKASQFITVWETTAIDESIVLGLYEKHGFYYNVIIDWGDGTIERVHSRVGANGNRSHTYSTPGLHEVAITGECRRHNVYWTVGVVVSQLKEIKQWGDIYQTDWVTSYYNASDLVITATDIPNLLNTPNTSHMFRNAPLVNPDVSNWDMSNINDISVMFGETIAANPDVSNWDTSNITNMGWTFWNAAGASPDCTNWDISNVTSMDSIFDGSAFSTANYDALLIAWAAKTVQPGVAFGAYSTQYTSSISGAARAILTDAPNNWNIWDDGPVGGTDLILNGDFATDTVWDKGIGWTIVGGVAHSDGTQSIPASLNQTGVAPIGDLYRITYTILNYVSGNARIVLGGNIVGTYQGADGTYVEVLTNSGSQDWLTIQSDADFVGDIDNVSVQKAL